MWSWVTRVITAASRLRDAVETLTFSPPVTHVYNPLTYARGPYEAYLRRYGAGVKEVVLLGMNPGPFGMAQTGVPFGDVKMVRDWFGIKGDVGTPPNEHPKRPVQGFECPRGEVSGQRVWTWAKERFGTADIFFERFFVLNYCPLVLMEESGKNRTPDKLSAKERDALFRICDQALSETIRVLKPTFAIGIGAVAEKRLQAAVGDQALTIGRILHPSPASPAANRGWAAQVDTALEEIGI